LYLVIIIIIIVIIIIGNTSSINKNFYSLNLSDLTSKFRNFAEFVTVEI